METNKGRILVLGSKGMLGGQLMRMFKGAAIGWDMQEVDVTNYAELKSKILKLEPKPWAVINCVAYNDVDGAEDNQALAFKLNAEVVGELAKICTGLETTLVHFSTNYVFDGRMGEYTEDDTPNPLSIYAQSKYEGEKQLAQNATKYYLVRTALLFGPKGESSQSKKSFIELMLEKALKTDTIKAVADEVNSLTYVKDLSEAVKLLLEEAPPTGIYHFVNSGEASWYDYAKEIFEILKKPVKLEPVLAASFPRKACRPKRAVLLSTKLPPLRPWQEALQEFLISNF